MIFVIAESIMKDENCKAEFIRIAKANIPTVRAEKGCISYELNEDCKEGPAAQRANPKALTFVECWESIEALQLPATIFQRLHEGIAIQVKHL